MKTIYIYVSDEVLATSVTGPMDMFNIANTLWHRLEGNAAEPLFDIKLVSLDGQEVCCSSGVVLRPSCSLGELTHCDFLLVGAYHYAYAKGLTQFLENQKASFPHFKRLYENGSQIGGYCSATFVLAASGLLDGKTATTSWWLKKRFVEQFKSIELSMDDLVVEQEGIWTAGATTSYLDLCLKLIERMAGQQIAMMVSKVMLLDINRPNQLPFIAMPKIIEHNDEVIANCQEWIQLNFASSINLDELSERSAMSKRNFIRRFKKAVGETPVGYLQRVRVEAAKRYLETTDWNLQQILEKVGYDDVSAFRKVFQRLTSLTPKAYRLKFAVSH